MGKFNVLPSCEDDVNELFIYNDPNLISQFKFLTGNRHIDKKHVKKLKGDFLITRLIAPCIVNMQTLNILDGQHRITAYKELLEEGKCDGINLKVVYSNLSLEDELKKVKPLNCDVKKWTLKDFVESSIDTENPVSIALCKMASEHPLLHSVTKKGNVKPKLRYAMACVYGRNITTDIKKGMIGITDEMVGSAQVIANESYQIFLALHQPSNSWVEYMIQAWHAMRNDQETINFLSAVNFNVILEEIERCPTSEFVTKKEVWHKYFRDMIANAKLKIRATTSAHAA
jgi:hypothetical protein